MYKLQRIALILLIGQLPYLGCSQYSRETPNEYLFLSGKEENRLLYRQDSIYLAKIIRSIIDSNNMAFHSNDFDQHTDFCVPEVFYSPGKDRIVFFVITKIDDSKMVMPELYENGYFSGFCFLGKRSESGTLSKIKWFDMFEYNSDHGWQNAFEGIKGLYFNVLSSIQTSDGEYRYKYNINDRRFWGTEIWEKDFESVD